MFGIRISLTSAALIAAVFVASNVQAQPVDGSNQQPRRDHSALAEAATPEALPAALSDLKQDWDRASFIAPTKPAQSIVNGRDGRTTSGAAYNEIVALMRGAELDAQQGRDQPALAKIAQAKQLLDR
jgi:hypothetical protein